MKTNTETATMEEYITKNPWPAIMASLSGSMAAIMSWMQVLTLTAGLIGGVLSVAAGWYALRIKQREYYKLTNGDRKKDDDDRDNPAPMAQ